MTPAEPILEVFSHVDRFTRSDIARLRESGQLALPRCREHAGPGPRDLAGLARVEVSVIDDKAIAAVHEEFLGDPTPTDVITFRHGEILIGLDTAEREAEERGHEVFAEVLLYLIHGLLHLNGHLDGSEGDRQRMHQAQDGIWREVIEREGRAGSRNRG